MSFSITTTDPFDKKAKRLARKYPSFPYDLTALVDELRETPLIGIPLGQDCYKVRLAISSKGRGKSGGARIITCVFVVSERVYLLSIYDKSEQDSISDKQITELRKVALALENAPNPPPPGSENLPSDEAL